MFDARKATRSVTHRLQSAGDGNLKPGSVLQNRYSIIKVLGVGGMGSVYQARDLRFPNVTKYVAVKEIINTADPGMREMFTKIFEREANTLASLDHPAIPKIYDYFNQSDRSFLVMEFIDGKDLETYLNEFPGLLSEEVVIEWAIELCDVLSYLHNHKDKDGNPEPIIFRDLKPSNIMLDQHGSIRLIDFGIARDYQAGQKGTMIGTEGYSPPEQYRGEASPAGDIYALGATLHHLLTKQDPRIEPPFTFAERPIRKSNPGVSLELETIIMTALNYNPAERFASAEAMKQALKTLRRRLSGSLSRPMGTGRIDAAAADSLGQARPAEAPAVISRSEVTPLWVFRCEDEIRASPVVSGSLVYVGAYDNNLYAINAADGKLVWKYATEGGLPAPPVIHQDILYIGSEDRRLHAISAKSGRLQWMYYADGPIRAAPRFADGHIFIGADDHYLHVVNASTGRKAWRYQASDAIRCRPVVSGDRVYFGCESGEFYALDLRAERKWMFRAKRGITSSPLLHNGTLYVCSLDGMVYALDASSGWRLWQFRTNKPILSSPTIDGNLLLVGSADNHLYAIDIRNGREAWRFATNGQVNSSPAVIGGTVYVGSVDHSLYAIEVASGRLRWKFTAKGPITSSPAIANNVVYIGSFDHHLYALTA
ncbi:MAG: serine/threonine-protein kinase [Anaerolineales bacterium]|nr:serine/threonine-protein kinase [Anaerolineales bacterium]